VITAAVMRLYPRPAASMTALASCESIAQCVELLQRVQARAAASLTGFEVMSDVALSLVRRHFPQIPQPLPASPWTVLLEVSDAESAEHARTVFEGVLEEALEAGLITDAAVASSVAQSRGMWHLRESISMAQSEEGLNIKHDISLPVSRIPAFVASTDATLARAFPGVRLVNFGHLGDGNLHYNVQAPAGQVPGEFLAQHEHAVNTLVYDAVQAHGGSISAEHGIGELKREELVERKSPVALSLMHAIKRALDPDQRMNPGRLLMTAPVERVAVATATAP
jgi:FAD/FMN-containing dehydrogenase